MVSPGGYFRSNGAYSRSNGRLSRVCLPGCDNNDRPLHKEAALTLIGETATRARRLQTHRLTMLRSVDSGGDEMEIFCGIPSYQVATTPRAVF